MKNSSLNIEIEAASQSLMICMVRSKFSAVLLDIGDKGISFEKIKISEQKMTEACV